MQQICDAIWEKIGEPREASEAPPAPVFIEEADQDDKGAHQRTEELAIPKIVTPPPRTNE